jgi:tripartite-type tricarboxylate transporter receptor subunit TctC
MQKDLQPITLLATAQYILVLHPSVPASSVKELVALAKQKPRSLNFASAGVGSPLHLAGELFQRRAGVEMVHIPYKGGGPAAAAVLGGEAQVLFGSVASSLPHVKSGKLKALATTGLKRSKVAPDLPTMAESGFPGFDVTTWYSLMAPAGTPQAIVSRIRDAAVKAIERPDVQQVMSGQGLEAESSTPQALAARIRSESKTWADLIKSAGIKAE